MIEKEHVEIQPKREAILAAARTLFSQKGYEETTIADIAKVAGIAVGTVYLYFHNKHEVYTAVSLDLEAEIAETFRNPAILTLPSAQMLQAIVDELFRVSREQMHLMSLLQIDAQSMDEILLHKQANETICDAVALIFQRAIDRGDLAAFNTEMYAQILNLMGSAVLHQCFAIEKGEREAQYRIYFIEILERLFFGPSLQEGFYQSKK